MTRISRSLSAAIVIGLFSATAHATTLKLAAPTGVDAATRAFLDRIEKSPLLASADLQIQSFPPGAIIAPGKTVAALESGIVDLALVPYSELVMAGGPAGLAHVSLLANPAVVDSPREQFAIQDSVYGDKIAVELGKRQLVSLAYWNRSAVALLAKKELKSLEDLKGQKVASVDPGARMVVVALGAQPATLPAGEVFAAVERGLVDAAEFAPPTAPTDNSFLNLYRGGTLLTNFRQPLGFFLAHQKTWLKLTQQQRDALTQTAKAAEQAARTIVLAEEERLPGRASENKVQLVSFSHIGKPFIDNDAPALWLKQTGNAGVPALQLLTKVKLDMTRPPLPRRGGALPAPKQPTILFATIRNDENKADLGSRFGIQRMDDPVLSCGTVGFTLPADRTPGQTYSGGISLPAGSPIQKDKDCYRAIGDVAQKSGGTLLIYVHGFWNTLDFAIRRTISVAADLGISSPVLVWSWPSAGHPSFYDYDEDSVNWSRIHFQNSVRALLGDPRIERMAFVCHSMGCRLAFMGLEAAYAHQRKAVIKDAVFIAPDVIRPDFRQYTKLFGAAADRLTLYATENDRALLISMDKHKDNLAGLGGDRITVLKGLDSVDATEVERLISTNHSYAFEIPEVLKDLKSLVVGNLAADKRSLKPATRDKLPYWLIPAPR